MRCNPVKSTHRIKVLGRELQIRSTARPERVAEVEAFVNRKLAEVEGSMSGGDAQMVAILTMLNIAESYLSTVRTQMVGETLQQERMERLLQRIDEALAAQLIGTRNEERGAR